MGGRRDRSEQKKMHRFGLGSDLKNPKGNKISPKPAKPAKPAKPPKPAKPAKPVKLYY